ncbi:hypothetical protein DFJ77DRAFT_444267 [Powellomyces hirtus]|nr:hypothetical protein DFJ77DRAFT_444267 [Powellomyces hirtus]
MSDTVLYDKSIQQLANKTKHRNIYFTDEVNNTTIREILNEQKELAEDGRTCLLYIDDAGNDAQGKNLNKELSNLYCKGRHTLCSSIVVVQSVRSQLSSKQKNNTTEWIIFKNNAEDMEILARLLTSAYKNRKEVLEYLIECTREPYSFCYINLAADDAKTMYRYCDKDGFKDYYYVKRMAFYRANYLEFQGINQSKGVPNVQRHQIGQALDYNDLDEYGRPNVTYSWNRNIHDKDMATKKNYTAPVREKQVSSAEVMRMSAGEHHTKAYKDGQEYVKAERDFRAKERYLDSITPSRRNHTVSIGTSTSTSGLPVPDTKGNVFHYNAATTAATGMMFEAPHDLPEVPQSADQLNANSTRINPVILTREKAISIDNATGAGTITWGSSSVLKPPVVSNPFEYQDPVMPGTFPDMGVVDVKRDEEMTDSFYIKSEPIEVKAEIALTTINDPREVEDIIANTEMSRDTFVAASAHSPFANLRRKPYARLKAPKKEKPTVEKAVLRTVDAAQERIALGPMEPSREVQVETINPRVRAQTLDPVSTRGVKRSNDAEEDSGRPAQKPRVGDLPEAFRLNPSVKRVALAGAPGRPTVHKKQRTDADVEEITLRSVKAVTKQRRGRNINAQIDATAVIDPRPQRTEAVAAGLLRPIAKLRGQPHVDFAIPPNFEVNPMIEEATGLRKKRPAAVGATRPAKRQKVIRTSSGLRNLEDTNLISPVVSGNMKAFTANSKITGFQKVAADTIENKHGPLLVNDVTSSDPITVTKEGEGVVSLGLEIDNKYLSIDEGALNYKPDVYEFPLTHELESKTVELITAAPFAVTEEGLSLFHDASLEIKEDGDLSVVKETVQAPLARDANGIKLVLDESLKVQHGMLGLDYCDPLFIDSESKLTLDHDPTLQVNAEGQLSVVRETLTEPIARGEDGSITFNYGRGLKLEDGELVSNTEDVLKPLGALHNGGIFDMGMDELTELGYDTLADLTDEVPDTDISLIRLRTSDDFTQKNTLASFGGKALAIKSKGNNKIPFYGVFDGFNVSSRLEYNDTLSELSVPHVELSQNFNPNSNEAVTQSYVAQYIQSGSAIDVAPETNNRRLLNVRTDATLQVDANNNLCVNVSPLVNGSSVKIDGNGKISGGYIFQSANGIRLREGTNNDVQLALNVEGALEKVGLNTIKENMTFETGLKRTGNSVALDLQGSEHIQVQGNTVSTTLKPYTAGSNVTISGQTISVNIPEETPYSGGGWYFTGMGITVTGSAAFGYIISSQNLKTQDDDDDEKKTDNEDDTLKNENNEVVQSTSPTSLIFPLPLIPFPPIPPIPLVPIFPIIGVLPSLLGFLGGFAVIFGYQRERKKKKNPDGTDQVDENGNPIYDLDDDGNYIWSEGSNVVIHSDKDTRRTTLMFDSWPEDVRVGRWCYGMNLEKTWEFEEKISRPWTIETVSSLVQPLDTRLLIAESSVANHGGRLYGAEIALDAVEAKVSILESNSPITVGKGLVKTGNVLSINSYQSETISAIGDVVFGMQRWVPSTVFFTDSEPSTTTVAGEAWGNGTDNVNRSHKAFANWGSSLYFTNLYTGAGAAGVSYKGEWIQIQLPAAKSISATRLRYRDGGNILGMPQTFCILGSSDGVTWNLLYHQSTPVGWSDSNRDPKWFPSTNTTAYSYIRLVCLTNGGGYAYCGVRLELFTPLDSVTINKPLFIGNGLAGSNATFSQTITASAAPTIGAHLVNRTFTDATYATITALGGTNTNLTSLTTRVTTAENTLTGKQNNLSVGTGLTLTGSTLTFDSTVIGTKSSVDALTTRTSKQNNISISSGLTLNGSTLGYDSSVLGTKASVDALTTRTSKQNNISISSGLTLNGSTLGYDPGIIATKASVDSLSTSKQDLITAGTGLSKSGATLSVNPAQTQITSVGTLTALSVNGYINITNTGSVALSIADNVSFGRCGANTQWFSNAQTGDAIIRASGSKVIRLGTNTNASIVDIFDGGMVVNSGNLTVATAPTLGSLTTTNTNVTNLTGRVVSLETGGTTSSKEITVWSKIKGSDTVPVPLPPAGGAALTAGTSTPTTWEHLNGTYTLTASSIYSAGYEAYRGFKSERLTAPWVSGNASWIDSNSTFVPGEWIAVDLPAARTISSVTIYQRLGEPSPSMPLRIAVLVGQSTGTMTVAVDQDNIPDVPSHTLNFTAGSYNLTTTTAGFPLALDHSAVKIISTEDSVSASSGALQISGGVGIGKNLFVGNVNNFMKTVAADTGGLLAAFGTTTSQRIQFYDGDAATLGARIHMNTGNACSITTAGSSLNLSPVVSVVITPTGESTSSTTGALQVAGGLSVQKSINIGTGTIPCGITTEVGGSTPLLNIGINFRHTPITTSGAAALRIDGRGVGANGTPFYFFTRLAGQSEIAVATIDMTGKLALNGGLLNLTNTASSGNLIHFSSAGVQAPTFSTRSTGTKIVLYPQIAADYVDYAVGMEGGHIWNSVPNTNNTLGFKWYGGTTQIARLDAVGNLSLNGSVDSKVPTFFMVDNMQITTYQNLPANVVTKIQMVTTTRYNKGVQSGWRNGTYDYVIPKTGLWQFHVSIGLTNFIGNNNIMFCIEVNGELPPDRISTQATINAQFPNQYSTVQGTFHLLLNANDIISLKFNPTIACYTAGLDWNCISKLSGQLIAAS